MAHEPLRVPPSPALRRWASQRGYSPEILARWDAFYPDVIRLVEALGKPPAKYIRLNTLAEDPRRTLEQLRAKGFTLEETPLPQAWRVTNEPFAIGATEEYLLGQYQLQDVSTQLAVMALEPEPGERVLDLAAAPGGKTIQIAQAMHNEGRIHAFDVDAERARALKANLARCRVRNAAVHMRDGADAVEIPGPADRVLLDAPCTGEGVIQRDPTRRRGHLEEYAQCSMLQSRLLDAAVAALRPGGLLVYSTCTLAPEENELQVEAALERHPLTLEPLPEAIRNVIIRGNALLPGLTRIADRQLTESIAHSAHTLPHLHGCLGFYLARLRKEAA